MSVNYREEASIGYITFDLPDSKVNVLSTQVLTAFEKVIDEFKNTSAIKVLVIQSAKKDIFIAGADIKEIETMTQILDAKSKAQAGQRILNKLEDLPIPTIAVIDGAALGGGCELALACTYRVATFSDKVRIGLPEVNLGFVPGFGGTYRMPRLVGLQGALKLILSGAPIDAQASLKMGLVDALYPQTGLADRVREFALAAGASPRKRIVKKITKKGFDAFLDNNPFGQDIVFGKSREGVLKATKGFYPAPLKALEVIKKTVGLKRAYALDIESSAFAELAVTPISKNLVKVFYMSEKFKKLSIPGMENIKAMPVKKGAVIGAGIMGGGIAQLLSNRGVWVRIKDINYDAVAKGLKAAYDVYAAAMKRRKLKPADLNIKMSMISGTLDYSGFKDADIVIEAVVENMDIKKKVFAEIGNQVHAQTILATNTSSLSVTQMASVAKDPSKVIGFHFFNPVHRMPLIEIITTSKTSPETLVSTLEFAKRLGKVPVVVKDGPGFLVNRILLGYINEAGRILEEGANIETVDRIAVKFGMPMGPFTLADEVGLDVGVKVLHILEAGLGARFKAVPIFDKVIEKKLLGKKSGKGFYVHGKERVVNPEAASLVRGGSGVSSQDALDRMMYIMVNEAAMILEEGIVDSADTVDVGMIMGTGFPPFRGGLLRYADSIGIAVVVKTMETFETKFKDGRFKPCQYLQKLYKEGKGFYQ